MKKIDELVISPWPWEETSLCRVTDCNDDFVANSNNPYNTRIIAASPELYECLREAVAEMCAAYCEENLVKCRKEDGKCFVQKWRDALAKASGTGQDLHD